MSSAAHDSVTAAMDMLRSATSGTLHGRITVRDPDWTTPQRGVRVRGDVPLTHLLVTEAAIRRSDRPAVACDLTAALMWSAVVPSGFGLEPDAQAAAIATLRGGNRHRAGGLRGRRLTLPPEHVTSLDGVRVTTPSRTWLDCAPFISFRDLVAMGDGMLHAGLVTMESLTAVVVWGRRRRGIVHARAALDMLDPDAESPGESWVRALLVQSGVPRPVCNPTVTAGGYEFRLDMAWVEQRVAVEYDGEEFHGPEAQPRDAWRRALLRQAGWTIIVIRKEDLRDADALVRRVLDALNHAAP